ncbi:MAG: hypothetical protein IKK46_08575 [Clostridia bacterium]|jgi:hypothetical protein|nr:hypothetical protein [Clostridia bacterium]MBR3810338.1 hypothetical protein [Clostridia bacterium]
MAIEVIVSLVSGCVAILCCLISSFIASSKAIAYIEKTQAITDTKLEELTREVRRHNNFAERMPVVEEQVKIINHRLNNLEKKSGG